MEIRSYLQFKLNAGRAAGEVLEWSRTRLGMSCAMSCWWERESFHCSAPPETQGQELSWAEPGTAIPTLPAGQELLQVQEWESCPSSCWWPQCRTIILGRPALRPILQHSCSCCSTAAPAAAQLLLLPAGHSLLCTSATYSPCQISPFGPLGMLLPVLRVQQLKKCLCMRMKQVKWKWSKTNCKISF